MMAFVGKWLYVWQPVVGLLLILGVECQSEMHRVGIIQEYCDGQNSVDELQSMTAQSAVSILFWKFECNDYIAFYNIMLAVNESKISQIIIIARREMLRFAESLMKTTSIQESVSIPLNNPLMVSGKVQTRRQQQLTFCNDRAGGKQFWGLVVSLIPDIIDNWQWRNIYLYVDEVFGLTEAKQIYTAFQAYQRVASLKLVQTTKTNKPTDFVTRLSHLDRGVREVKAVIIICGHHITKEILIEASQRKLFSTFYRWLIFENGTEDILRAFKMQYDTDVLLLRHSDGKTIATSAASALNKFSENPTHLNTSQETLNQFGPKPKESVANQCFSDSFVVDSKFAENRTKIFGREYLPQDLKLEFMRVRRRNGNALPGLDFIGEWTAANGLENITALQYDFDGLSIQIAAIHCPPYVFIQRNLEGQYSFKGYLIDLLNALAHMMNFRYNITVPFDQTYGRCEGKICTGLLGVLARQEADLALANLTPTGPRIKLMDFSTVSVDKAGLGVLIRRPSKTDSSAIKAYIMPFSWQVSLCVAGAIPLFGFLLHVALRIGARYQIRTEETDSSQLDSKSVRDNRSVGRCLFSAIQSFSQQGIDIIPETSSGRVVFGMMWLFSLFIMSAYTANLISYFTSSFVSYPFKRLEDAFSRQTYKFGFIKGTTYLDDIQGENNSVLTKIWKTVEKQKFTTLVDNMEEGLERVRTESYLLLHEARILQYITGKDCEFDMINEKYLSAPMMLAFQRNSQFRAPISLMLLKISESGLLEKLKNQWWPPTFDCSIAFQTFSSISLWGMTSIFGILASGIVLGGVLVLLEKGIAAQKIQSRLRKLSQAIPDNLTNIRVPLSVPSLN